MKQYMIIKHINAVINAKYMIIKHIKTISIIYLHRKRGGVDKPPHSITQFSVNATPPPQSRGSLHEQCVFCKKISIIENVLNVKSWH